MNAAEMLFSGDSNDGKRLSNEAALAEICPAEFKKGNHWTELVDVCYVKGNRRARLRFKMSDLTVREKKWDCFRAVLATLILSHEDKIAVGGWMLSEIVIEVDPNAS